MNSVACTLMEDDYHHGAAALANSLFTHGYRGRFWVGYRGPLPPWAKSAVAVDGGHELQAAPGFAVRFAPLETSNFLTTRKPEFLLELLERRCPDAPAAFYFDADVVIRRDWRFFEDWVGRGIAVCEDRFPYGVMPPNRFHWSVWREFAEGCGHRLSAAPTQHFNAGFVGVSKAHAAFLRAWRGLMEALGERGADLKAMRWKTSDSYPYIDSDQDAFNMALAIGSWPLCTLGPESMDFVPWCFEPRVVMSHAAGKIKPWNRRLLLDALSGRGPEQADRAFWRYAADPIRSFPPWRLRCNRWLLRGAEIIGRVVPRRLD